MATADTVRHFWELGNKSPDLPRRIMSAIQSTEGWRARRLWDIAALAWLYERERYLSQIGVGGEAISTAAESYPDFVQGRASWLLEVPPSINVIKSSADTVVARLMTELPPCEVLTENAPHEEREAAEERTDALNGTMNTPPEEATFRRVGRDGVIKGFGAIRPRVELGQVRVERIHQYQLAWDPYDARNGNPSILHHWRRISKSKVLGKVWTCFSGEEREKLYGAIKALAPVAEQGPYQDHYVTPYEQELDAAGCEVEDDALIWVETWRLPAALAQDGEELPEELRGRYIITIHGSGSEDEFSDSGVVLHDDEWKRTTFPIVWWSPFPSDEGIDGTGLGHAMMTWQAVVDRTVAKIQKTLDKLSHTKILVREGVIRNLRDLLNMGIDVVEVAPEVLGDKGYDIIAPSVLNAEELRWLEWILQNCQSWSGINAMLSQGGSQLGAGAAAVALVEEDHRQLDRLADVDREFTEFRLKVAREVLNAIDDAIKEDKTFRAQWRDADGSYRRKPWSKLIADNANYHVDIEPVGVLGKTRSGRITKLLDLVQRQAVDPALASDALMTSPDMRRIARTQTAGRRLVESQLSELVRPDGDHETIQPDENTPPKLAADLALARIQLALAERGKPETIQRLVAYRQAALDLEKKQQQQAQPVPAPGGPMGMPPSMMPAAVAA